MHDDNSTDRKINVLFIDDEGYWAKPYRDRLEEAFGNVQYCDEADQALEYFAKTSAIDVIILDVMMPTPAGWDDRETDGGLETGIVLLKRMRKDLIHRRIPVLILTNRGRSIIDDRLHELDFPEGLVEVRVKQEMPAFALPSRLRSLQMKWRA